MIAITNGHILTVAGKECENGFLLLGDDGRILEIGEGVSIPAGGRGVRKTK